MDVSGEFWSRFDAWAGPTFGVALFLLGAFLMFKGARSIKLLSFVTGCAIGLQLLPKVTHERRWFPWSLVWVLSFG